MPFSKDGGKSVRFCVNIEVWIGDGEDCEGGTLILVGKADWKPQAGMTKSSKTMININLYI